MALNIQQQRIATFLAQGLKPVQIASIVGVTASYISQLCGEGGPEGFIEAVKGKAIGQQEEGVSEEELISSKYLAIEHKLLNAMESAMMGAELPALTGALKAIIDRQERRAARKAGIMVPGGMQNTQVNITVLQLPSHAVPEYQVNGQGQVLAVDGQCLSPMNSNAVKSLFKDKRQGNTLLQEAVKATQGAPAHEASSQILAQELIQAAIDF